MCMRVAVLGARGLIGGAVVRRAILAGHHVRAIVRPGGGVAGFPAGTEVIAADLRSRESVVDAVRRMEVVVHAASVPYPEWPRVVPLLADNAFAARQPRAGPGVFPATCTFTAGHALGSLRELKRRARRRGDGGLWRA